jgi:hypothetical protein
MPLSGGLKEGLGRENEFRTTNQNMRITKSLIKTLYLVKLMS